MVMSCLVILKTVGMSLFSLQMMYVGVCTCVCMCLSKSYSVLACTCRYVYAGVCACRWVYVSVCVCVYECVVCTCILLWSGCWGYCANTNVCNTFLQGLASLSRLLSLMRFLFVPPITYIRDMINVIKVNTETYLPYNLYELL